jgi:hypothetical protein
MSAGQAFSAQYARKRAYGEAGVLKRRDAEPSALLPSAAAVVAIIMRATSASATPGFFSSRSVSVTGRRRSCSTSRATSTSLRRTMADSSVWRSAALR